VEEEAQTYSLPPLKTDAAGAPVVPTEAPSGSGELREKAPEEE
jgi:hypothetical protein